MPEHATTEHATRRRRRWQNHTALAAVVAISFLAANLGAVAHAAELPAGAPIAVAGTLGLCLAALHTVAWAVAHAVDDRRSRR